MKKFTTIFLLIALSFSEVAVTIVMTNHLGAAKTYALFAVPTIVGLVIQWFQWQKVKLYFAEMTELFAAYDHLEGQEKTQAVIVAPRYRMIMGEQVLFYITLVLLLVPGFVTDFIAFALLLPSVRKVIREKVFAPIEPKPEN